MLYKPNWDVARKLLEAYWKQENEERPAMSFTAVKGNRVPRQQWASVQEGSTDEEHWLHAGKIIERYVKYFENTYFPAETMPFIDVNLGPGITAAYLGCPGHMNGHTVWFDPIIGDWHQDSFGLDENNFWWKKTKEITAAACKAGKGRFLTGMTDLSGILDIMAHMRGTQNLLFDLMDDGEIVKEVRDRILKLWFHYFDELSGIMEKTQEGSINWLGMWAPGPCHALQCDFSAMISPSQFEEFYLPEIQEQCRRFPYSIFHLDGPDCVRHLDLLLEIPELTAIQWQPGAGQPMSVGWIPLLKKIQDKGKSICIDAKYEHVEEILEELSCKGLYINIYEALDNPQEAEDFIKLVKRVRKP